LKEKDYIGKLHISVFQIDGSEANDLNQFSFEIKSTNEDLWLAENGSYLTVFAIL
jgi:hypothetical protein